MDIPNSQKGTITCCTHREGCHGKHGIASICDNQWKLIQQSSCRNNDVSPHSFHFLAFTFFTSFMSKEDHSFWERMRDLWSLFSPSYFNYNVMGESQCVCSFLVTVSYKLCVGLSIFGRGRQLVNNILLYWLEEETHG